MWFMRGRVACADSMTDESSMQYAPLPKPPKKDSPQDAKFSGAALGAPTATRSRNRRVVYRVDVWSRTILLSWEMATFFVKVVASKQHPLRDQSVKVEDGKLFSSTNQESPPQTLNEKSSKRFQRYGWVLRVFPKRCRKKANRKAVFNVTIWLCAFSLRGVPKKHKIVTLRCVKKKL